MTEVRNPNDLLHGSGLIKAKLNRFYGADREGIETHFSSGLRIGTLSEYSFFFAI